MHQMRISSNYVSSVMPGLINLEIRDVMAVKTQTESREIRQRIELCMREIILCFEINLRNWMILSVKVIAVFSSNYQIT
jgi:hypothetical protein